mmetsp:Transcript_106161/g.310329  ORF Transcript_106161/g.310329 Transcript_106161/m.310329 type:complete len:89 (-) Transcript_106161:245-511(-)
MAYSQPVRPGTPHHPLPVALMQTRRPLPLRPWPLLPRQQQRRQTSSPVQSWMVIPAVARMPSSLKLAAAKPDILLVCHVRVHAAFVIG